jgi:hypothetical protein
MVAVLELRLVRCGKETMAMPHPRYTDEEIGRRGNELYQRLIRPQVEATNKGKYLLIDIETGDYEIGDDYMILSDRLHARHKDAALYAMRIGYPATARIGARHTPAGP